jgi:ABC-type branched-subunit amino acid transport system substrate-binding protein
VRHHKWIGFVGILAAGALALTACGGSSGRGSDPESSAGAGGGAASAPASASTAAKTFGTLASPCGPGDATGATDRGVTNDTITIGYGDDRGFAQSPGLNKEMGDSIKAFIKWCNDQGGINGRQLVGHFYDAKITLANNVMTQACASDFMLVGEGFAADGAAEATRVKCNMVTAEGYSVLAAFANGPMQYQGVPNPVDFTPGSSYYQMVKLYPEEVKKFALVDSSLEASHTSLQKDEAAMIKAGMVSANCDVTLNYLGESDYKPFVQKLKSCGVKLLMANVSPGPVINNFLTAMHQLDYNPVFLMETNLYSSQFSAANTNGYANNAHIRSAFIPLEEASVVPAVQQYIDIVKADGGSFSQLGEQAVSSFLLWAQSAKSCGSTLTRQCMVTTMSKVHDWTGGGLHANTDPGSNKPPKCGMLIKLTGSTFSREYPTKPGTLECDDKFVVAVPQALWGVPLNSDRIATTFLTPNVIKPQS